MLREGKSCIVFFVKWLNCKKNEVKGTEVKFNVKLGLNLKKKKQFKVKININLNNEIETK